jgi:hypothetical protein
MGILFQPIPGSVSLKRIYTSSGSETFSGTINNPIIAYAFVVGAGGGGATSRTSADHGVSAFACTGAGGSGGAGAFNIPLSSTIGCGWGIMSSSNFIKATFVADRAAVPDV